LIYDGLDAESVFMGKARARWPVEEKRRIVELTLEPGPSVARVAQAEGVNANQVFQWRRAYRDGELPSSSTSAALLPVVIGAKTGITAKVIWTMLDKRSSQGESSDMQPPQGEAEKQIAHPA
jgi:transposase-like protein